MVAWLKVYGVCLGAFLVVDGVWLGIVAPGFYQEQLGFLLADQVNWWAAGVFYLLFVVGVQIFVVMPGIRAGSLRATLARGAFFGLVTYATYDLTNLATVAGWPVVVTVVDMIWGAALAGIVGSVGYLVGRRFIGATSR
jgi:uncharacterized membrane protein